MASKYKEMLELICDEENDYYSNCVDRGDWSDLFYSLSYDTKLNPRNIAKYLVKDCGIDPSLSEYYPSLFFPHDSTYMYRYSGKGEYSYDDNRHELIKGDTHYEIWARSKKELAKFYADHGVTIDIDELDDESGFYDAVAIQLHPSIINSQAKVYIMV